MPATAGTVSTLIAWQQNPVSPGPPRSACATPPTAPTSGPSRSSPRRRWGPTDADRASSPPATSPATPPSPGSRATGAEHVDRRRAALSRRRAGSSPSSVPLRRARPTRCCLVAGARSCGARPRYTVRIDGTPGRPDRPPPQIVAPVRAHQRPPHVAGERRPMAGLTNAPRRPTVFVDTVRAARARCKLSGTVRSATRASNCTVSYTDAPPPGCAHVDCLGRRHGYDQLGRRLTAGAHPTHHGERTSTRASAHLHGHGDRHRPGREQDRIVHELKIKVASPSRKQHRRARKRARRRRWASTASWAPQRPTQAVRQAAGRSGAPRARRRPGQRLPASAGIDRRRPADRSACGAR